jgi:hypothetical protein
LNTFRFGFKFTVENSLAAAAGEVKHEEKARRGISAASAFYRACAGSHCDV